MVAQYTGPPPAPAGAEFASLRIGNNRSSTGPGDDEVAVYRTAGLSSEAVEHAYIVVHGKECDAAKYWRRLETGLRRAREAGHPGADRAVLVLAPIFFSLAKNRGQVAARQLAWCARSRLDVWQGGARADQPPGTAVSSMNVLDSLLEHLADRTTHPRLRNITVIGHSAGAQLVQRYAAVGADAPGHVHVRYVHASESKYAYFTANRPVVAGEPPRGAGSEPTMTSDIRPHPEPQPETCAAYNTWPYGFSGGHIPAHVSAEEAFRRYTRRDVVSIVGYLNTSNHGDQTCEARLQGGRARRNRNLAWYRYVHTLARTPHLDLADFPGRFAGTLPDWRRLAPEAGARLRIAIVRNAGHGAARLFRSRAARPVLFDAEFASPNWRPHLQENDEHEAGDDDQRVMERPENAGQLSRRRLIFLRRMEVKEELACT